MTLFDKNIDLRVAKICRKKYEQLIIDDCYDKGKVYIVEDPNITADNLKIINLAPGEEDRDAVNIKQLKDAESEIDKKIKELSDRLDHHVKAQIKSLVRYCTIDLTSIDGLMDGVKAICTYTMLIDKDCIDFLCEYDVETTEGLEDVIRYLCSIYEIEVTTFNIDDMYNYVEKISNKIGFKILK